MNTDDDDDIARLFAQFGGDPGVYQEIATVAAAKEARSRWPVLSAFDPLSSIAAPAVGADDAAVVEQAVRKTADEAADADMVSPRVQFIPPRPMSFSREVPQAFLAPVAPPPQAAEFPAVQMAQELVAPVEVPPPLLQPSPPSPAVSQNPFRRLAAPTVARDGTERPSDLFKRLLSS